MCLEGVDLREAQEVRVSFHAFLLSRRSSRFVQSSWEAALQPCELFCKDPGPPSGYLTDHGIRHTGRHPVQERGINSHPFS